MFEKMGFVLSHVQVIFQPPEQLGNACEAWLAKRVGRALAITFTAVMFAIMLTIVMLVIAGPVLGLLYRAAR